MFSVNRRHALILCCAVLIALTTSGSAPPSQSSVALMMAKIWAESSLNPVADTLGRAATLNIPLLKSLAVQAIKEKIRNRLDWTFSPPQRLGASGNDYTVVATAHVPFDVSLLSFQAHFVISGDFRLRVDTRRQRVLASDFDSTSFRFRQVQK